MSTSWAKGSTRRWREIRRAVLARDGGVCQLQLPGCVQVATHVDHIVAKSLGGDDTMPNLRAACGPCNQSRGQGRAHRAQPNPIRVTQW